MDLRLLDNFIAGLHPPPLLALGYASGRQSWARQFASAEALVRADVKPGTLVPGVARQTRRATELEPCGCPQAVGAAGGMQGVAPPDAHGSGDARAPSPPASQDVPERPPVRVHIDRPQAGGVHVWLGIDRTPQVAALDAATLSAGLRHALEAALPDRVAGLVCNGVPIYPIAAAVARPLQRPSASSRSQP